MKQRWRLVAALLVVLACIGFAWLRWFPKVHERISDAGSGRGESESQGPLIASPSVSTPVTDRTNQVAPLRSRPETVSSTQGVASHSQARGTISTQSRAGGTPPPELRNRNGVGFTPPWLDRGGVNPITGQPEKELIGIGAVLMRENGAVRVRDVIADSPAALANLSGFIIERVDGVSLAEVSLEECVRLIRGAEGSSVTLDVIDPSQQRQTIQVVRNKVKLAN
jgi:hypothetical protein